MTTAFRREGAFGICDERHQVSHYDILRLLDPNFRPRVFVQKCVSRALPPQQHARECPTPGISRSHRGWRRLWVNACLIATGRSALSALSLIPPVDRCYLDRSRNSTTGISSSLQAEESSFQGVTRDPSRNAFVEHSLHRSNESENGKFRI